MVTSSARCCSLQLRSLVSFILQDRPSFSQVVGKLALMNLEFGSFPSLSPPRPYARSCSTAYPLSSQRPFAELSLI